MLREEGDEEGELAFGQHAGCFQLRVQVGRKCGLVVAALLFVVRMRAAANCQFPTPGPARAVARTYPDLLP